ncbi:MAG: glycosyl hydrolase family 25 [Ruminococcus sp.]|nr:glycosyl hydrolase family 25 [Ruminococcus sp.]
MRAKRMIACCLAGAVMTGAAVLGACYFSTAAPDTGRFPVFGVDVSNYQGGVDWQALEEQGVRFAFVKATEGSGHTDESVRRNLETIQATDIRVSAYHFFSFDSAGETQAANFIAAVAPNEIDMPPVVDIEYYGDKRTNKPSRAEAEAILRPLLTELEAHYGTKPIIYTTLPVYYRYVRADFADYPLWIRSVNFEPDIVDWKFWQYCDTGELYGFSGDEKYIDLNVYCGSEEDFLAEYPKK